MTDPIAKVSGPLHAIAAQGVVPAATRPETARAAPTAPTSPARDDRTEKLRHAAGEFEAIFVKQLLKEAHMGGAQKSSSGYADMAVDAMASGIQHGGGLGLAKQIERALAASGALGPQGHPAKASAAPPHVPPRATIPPKR